MPIEKESPEERGYASVDCNLSESSVSDARLGALETALADLTLPYCEHRGDARLREQIASLYAGVGPDDVLVTAGAAAALFIVHTSLLEPNDPLVVEHPNYGTNLETPRAIGCRMELLPLRFEDGFLPDLDELRRLCAARPRLVSVTNPHNPTGVMKPAATLDAIAEIAAGCGARLLVDETYRDVSDVAKPALAAARDPRAISVSSVSKAFGLPGLRIGWIVCRDPELRELFLAAKEQIFICNSVVDEALALRFLERRADLLPAIRERTARNYSALTEFMGRSEWLEWVPPDAAVVAFPRFREDVPVDTGEFYRLLLDEYRTMVGPGHWFEMEDRCMRIGFGYPGEAEMTRGLANVAAAAGRARR